MVGRNGTTSVTEKNAVPMSLNRRNGARLGKTDRPVEGPVERGGEELEKLVGGVTANQVRNGPEPHDRNAWQAGFYWPKTWAPVLSPQRHWA